MSDKILQSIPTAVQDYDESVKVAFTNEIQDITLTPIKVDLLEKEN